MFLNYRFRYCPTGPTRRTLSKRNKVFGGDHRHSYHERVRFPDDEPLRGSRLHVRTRIRLHAVRELLLVRSPLHNRRRQGHQSTVLGGDPGLAEREEEGLPVCEGDEPVGLRTSLISSHRWKNGHPWLLIGIHM